jgi:hypothetical protein
VVVDQAAASAAVVSAAVDLAEAASVEASPAEGFRL